MQNMAEGKRRWPRVERGKFSQQAHRGFSTGYRMSNAQCRGGRSCRGGGGVGAGEWAVSIGLASRSAAARVE